MLCSFPSLTKYDFSRINLLQGLLCHNDDTRNKYHLRIMSKTSKAKHIESKYWKGNAWGMVKWGTRTLLINWQQLNYEVRKCNLIKPGNVMQKLLHWCVVSFILSTCDGLQRLSKTGIIPRRDWRGSLRLCGAYTTSVASRAKIIWVSATKYLSVYCGVFFLAWNTLFVLLEGFCGTID